MKRNNFLIGILTLISLMFVGSLVILIGRPEAPINQTVNRETNQSTAVKQGAMLLLSPESISTTSGEIISVALNYQDLNSEIEAADIILPINPSFFEFVTIKNLNPNFTNPRALIQDGRLILSFVNKGISIETTDQPENLKMGELVLRALKPGNYALTAEINEGPSSSMVIGPISNDNQLISASEVSITVNQ